MDGEMDYEDLPAVAGQLELIDDSLDEPDDALTWSLEVVHAVEEITVTDDERIVAVDRLYSGLCYEESQPATLKSVLKTQAVSRSLVLLKTKSDNHHLANLIVHFFTKLIMISGPATVLDGKTLSVLQEYLFHEEEKLRNAVANCLMAITCNDEIYASMVASKPRTMEGIALNLQYPKSPESFETFVELVPNVCYGNPIIDDVVLFIGPLVGQLWQRMASYTATHSIINKMLRALLRVAHVHGGPWEISRLGGARMLNTIVMQESGKPEYPSEVLCLAVAILAKISSMPGEQLGQFFDMGIIQCAVRFLEQPQTELADGACWTLANLAEARGADVRIMLDEAGLVRRLIDLAEETSEIQQVASQALLNILEFSTFEQLVLLGETHDVLKFFVRSVTVLGPSEDATNMALLAHRFKGLNILLKVGTDYHHSFADQFLMQGGRIALRGLLALETPRRREVYDQFVKLLEEHSSTAVV